MNNKTEKPKFLDTKTENRSKNGQNRKTKNPMPPSLSDVTRKRSASSHIYTETGKKVSLGIFRVLTFFFLAEKDLFIENMLHRLNLFGHL